MKTCVITGAGSGIGRAAAIALAENKEIQIFVLISLGMEDLEKTKEMIEEIRSGNGQVLMFDQDITKYDEVNQIIEEVQQRFGRIDILLNIAGYSRANSFLDTSMEMFRTTMEINVLAMFNITKAVVNTMKETGGVIVNIASTSGSTPRPGWLAYATSKSAVIGYSRTLAYELKDFGIKVFNISPGRCATEMRRALRPDEDASKIMQPQEVGSLIALLVNNPDCNIDGQDIIVRRLD